MAAAWDELTLEGLLLFGGSARYVPREMFLDSALRANPPKPELRDDVCTYVLGRWCPWYSQTCGRISEACLNSLTARILGHGTDFSGSLELFTAAILLLTRPNLTSRPETVSIELAQGLLYRL